MNGKGEDIISIGLYHLPMANAAVAGGISLSLVSVTLL